VNSGALIVGAVPISDAEEFYRELLAGAAYVIACDAAGEWCLAAGRKPDLAIGDFDSAEPGAAERLAASGIEVVRVPAAKNESDLDLALGAARERGYTDVTLTAAYSQRLDHTLVAIGTMLRAVDLNPRVEEPGFSAVLADSAVRPIVEFTIEPGTTVSVIAVVDSFGVTLGGLEYPLVNASLPLLSSLGLSNVASPEGRVRVEVAQGTLLVIASRGEVASTPN